MSKEKIFILRRTNEYGGCEILLLDWLKYIDYDRHTVYLGSTTDYFTEKFSQYGLPVRYVPLSLPFVGNFFGIYRKWKTFLKSISPDRIVIMQGGFFECTFPCFLAAHRVTKGNVYMTEHLAAPLPPEKTSSVHFGFIPGFGLWWHKKMWALRARGLLSKHILAVSEEVKNRLVAYGYPSGNVTVAFHGIDVARYSPSESVKAEVRRKYGIPEDALVFVSTARMSPQKRIERIIKAFDELSSAHNNIWVLLAGDGPLKENMQSLAASVREKHRIKMLGQLEDVVPILQAGDIYLLPSDNEGLSVALTEAMSAGLVCVATDVSGSREIIEDGVNGFLVEPSEPGVLRGMEKVILMGEGERTAIACKAREAVQEKFEIGKSVRNILHLLKIGSI